VTKTRRLIAIRLVLGDVGGNV